ncbi:hypothetical protein EDD21DRAFT_379812 [Dissophora ornata]|nr:hypothetical protein EDD21DRAFT_379812 [Dissophora ornata]
MAVVTQHPQLMSQSPVSGSQLESPPQSPPQSPLQPPLESVLATASSSTSSVDRLPPAFCAERATPAPCDDHANMDSHHSDIALDHDEENYQDTHHPFQSRQTFSEISQPISPPTTVVTAMAHSSSVGHDMQAATSSMETDLTPPRRSNTGSSFAPTSATTITSFFTAPRSQPPASQHNRLEHQPSPFSYFAISATTNEDHVRSAAHVKTLNIQLAQSEIVLMEGKTTKLEGVLHLNLQKDTKIKSLHLDFTGRSSVTWLDENSYAPATRHTTAPHIEHSWPFISQPNKKGVTVVPAGQHTYPFSLVLPDTLPESLATSHGKISYKVTATLTKPGLTFNSSSTTARIQILRRYSSNTPGSRIYQRGGRILSSPEDKVQFKIALPQIRVPHGTKIPLRVSITSPNSRTAVHVLQVSLWERVVYKADGRERVDMRLVKIQKSEGWTSEVRDGRPVVESMTWNKVLLFDMPQMGPEINQCNPSADTGLMKVEHLFRFSVLGSDGAKRFRIEKEIDVRVLAFEDEYLMPEGTEDDENNDPSNELPSYLTSFSTPRVSFDSEREMDPADDDLLRSLIARIHLPTYAESEEDTRSRGPSRDVSRDPSRDVSRNVSRAPSRATSPERSQGGNNTFEDISTHLPLLQMFNPHPVSPFGYSRSQEAYQARIPTPPRGS